VDQLSLLEQSRREVPGLDDRERVALIADQGLRDLEAEAPIDLDMVASYYGVDRVRVAPLPDAGWLVCDPDTGRVQICLRASDSPRRRRFTGFHEVTHSFFTGYRRWKQRRCDPPRVSARGDDTESLCDIGAAEFLLPARLVGPDLAESEFSLQVVEDLARDYHASLEASAHRVVELWPEEAVLIVAEVRTKPSEKDIPEAIPKLRVNYCWKKGSWPFIRGHKSISDEWVPDVLGGRFISASGVAMKEVCSEVVEGLDLSARLFPYTDQEGVVHERVLMLYRRPATRH
jgi:hypothetical protein